jgi:hypothetical protein
MNTDVSVYIPSYQDPADSSGGLRYDNTLCSMHGRISDQQDALLQWQIPFILVHIHRLFNIILKLSIHNELSLKRMVDHLVSSYILGL